MCVQRRPASGSVGLHWTDCCCTAGSVKQPSLHTWQALRVDRGDAGWKCSRRLHVIAVGARSVCRAGPVKCCVPPRRMKVP